MPSLPAVLPARQQLGMPQQVNHNMATTSQGTYVAAVFGPPEMHRRDQHSWMVPTSVGMNGQQGQASNNVGGVPQQQNLSSVLPNPPSAAQGQLDNAQEPPHNGLANELPPADLMADALEYLQINGVQQNKMGEVLVPVQSDGMQVTLRSNAELRKMLTECMLVGEGVEEKMIRKIWSGQFIEFMELLQPEDAGVYDVTYNQEDGNKQMALSHRPKKEITNYDNWLRAWEVYHVIYLRHPCNRNKHQQMVTYAKNNRQFRKQQYNWISYDRNFR